MSVFKKAYFKIKLLFQWFSVTEDMKVFAVHSVKEAHPGVWAIQTSMCGVLKSADTGRNSDLGAEGRD